MKVIARTGKDDLALVYIAKTDSGKLIEFVESLQPPIPREKKWVLIVSTLFGCPVACRLCDAGSYYQGKLSKDDIISQIDFLVKKRYPDRKIPVEKFKIQFARLGEPSFNQNVLEALKYLPELYKAPGLLPSLSTVAPLCADKFFKDLLEIKKKYFKHRFQFQFSIHTTDESLRNWLIPIRKWSFQKMADYGTEFYNDGCSKISLNFALSSGGSIDPNILLKFFNPNIFIIKITPVNPTYQAKRNNITSAIPHKGGGDIVKELRVAGYDVIISTGEFEENLIGSNCGQYITAFNRTQKKIKDAYSYEIQFLDV